MQTPASGPRLSSCCKNAGVVRARYPECCGTAFGKASKRRAQSTVYNGLEIVGLVRKLRWPSDLRQRNQSSRRAPGSLTHRSGETKKWSDRSFVCAHRLQHVFDLRVAVKPTKASTLVGQNPRSDRMSRLFGTPSRPFKRALKTDH